MGESLFDDLSIAILHDHFPFLGGAEQVALEAAHILDAPLYTTYIDPQLRDSLDIEVIPVCQAKYTNKGFNQLITSSGAISDQTRALSMLLDLSNIAELQQYDVVLESGQAAKHYTPSVDQTIFNYIHTFPQYYYNLYKYSIRNFDYPVVRTLVKSYIKLARIIDKEANDYVDQFIANSDETEARVKTYYDRDAAVVYPPVFGDWRYEADDGYFITWSRLDPKKRVGLIAKAFTHLDERLIIAGDGPERKVVEQIARGHDNIEVHGYVEDIESLVAHARAVVYAPLDEPFGLVGAEALCAGKPLIGVDDGYTKYQVTPETGCTFDPEVDSLVKTIKDFDPDKYDNNKIQNIGEKYSRENFKESLYRVLNTTI